MRQLNPQLGAIEFLFPQNPMHIGGLAEGMGYNVIEKLIPKLLPPSRRYQFPSISKGVTGTGSAWIDVTDDAPSSIQRPRIRKKIWPSSK